MPVEDLDWREQKKRLRRRIARKEHTRYNTVRHHLSPHEDQLEGTGAYCWCHRRGWLRFQSWDGWRAGEVGENECEEREVGENECEEREDYQILEEVNDSS